MGQHSKAFSHLKKICPMKYEELEAQSVFQRNIVSSFSRRFNNPDMATCWLNSCLQLLLTAIDYEELTVEHSLTSELGQELLRLHFLSSKEPLDPTCVKDIIVTSEDTRIAMRISELTNDVIDEALLEYQST